MNRWIGVRRKGLSDGKSNEVTYHPLCPGQHFPFDEAITKELSKVLTAEEVRLLSQEEELNVKPERLLRMRWVLTWKYTEGGDRKAGSLLVSFAPLHVCSSRGTEFASSAQQTTRPTTFLTETASLLAPHDPVVLECLSNHIALVTRRADP